MFQRIHPTPTGLGRDRFEVLRDLRELGYEVGSGVMIGIPGQSYADLARDIELFRTLDLDMIGTGPWLEHPDTPLASFPRLPEGERVPNTEEMTYKVVALARLSCPFANIPATTALATVNKQNGRELGLQRGANILMPNVTPVKYRALYEIYPAKACVSPNGAGMSRLHGAAHPLHRPRAGRRSGIVAEHAPAGCGGRQCFLTNARIRGGKV